MLGKVSPVTRPAGRAQLRGAEGLPLGREGGVRCGVRAGVGGADDAITEA